MTAISTLLPGHVVQPLGWTLLHFVWQGLAAWLLLAMFLRLLGRASANARYLAGCVGLALMAALPVVTFGRLYTTPSAAAWSTPAAQAPLARPADPVSPAPGVKSTSVRAAPSLQHPGPPLAPPWPVTARAWCEARLAWLVAGWLTGVLVLAAWMLFGWVRLQSWRRRLVAPLARQWQAVVAELAERLRVRRSVRVLASTLADVPTAFGWLRPVILLPARALTSLAPEQLRALLAHELAHIKRYDYLVNLVQSALETLLFYHPAVWWLSRRIRLEREHCCDDLAVAVCGSPAVYVGALASAAELARLRPHLRVAASGGVLLGRIRRLISAPARQGQGPTAWVAAVLVVAMLVGGLASVVWPSRPAQARAQEPERPVYFWGATSLGVPVTWPQGVDTSRVGGGGNLPRYSPSGQYLAVIDTFERPLIWDLAAGSVWDVYDRATPDRPNLTCGQLFWLADERLWLLEHWNTDENQAYCRDIDHPIEIVRTRLGWWRYRVVDWVSGATLLERAASDEPERRIDFTGYENGGQWIVRRMSEPDYQRRFWLYDPLSESFTSVLLEAGEAEFLLFPRGAWIPKILAPPTTNLGAVAFDMELVNYQTGETHRLNAVPPRRWFGLQITADGRYLITSTYDTQTGRSQPMIFDTATGQRHDLPATESWGPAALSESRGVLLVYMATGYANGTCSNDWAEIPLSALLPP